MADEPKGRRGRPAHVPTEVTRALVSGLVGRDKTLSEIAEALNLSEPTVRLHYADELLADRPQLNFSFVKNPAGKIVRVKNPRMGRPEHVPTDDTREQVEILVAGGMRHWQIAAALGISEPTLNQYYQRELDTGRSRKTAAVLQALFQAGVKGGNVAALKAWLAQPHGLEDAPPPEDRPAKEQPMGKKEQQMNAAFTAAQGTPWAGLLPN